MRLSRFALPVVSALGATVVVALPLSLSGCGGASNGQPEVVAPKVPLTVSAKDSINNYLNKHPAKGQKK
jgi:hypothetical protein